MGRRDSNSVKYSTASNLLDPNVEDDLQAECQGFRTEDAILAEYGLCVWKTSSKSQRAYADSTTLPWMRYLQHGSFQTHLLHLPAAHAKTLNKGNSVCVIGFLIHTLFAL